MCLHFQFIPTIYNNFKRRRYAYAFSIKPSKPEGTDYGNNRGEWVNAGFDGSDGTYNEWYQVENGKIIAWSQTKGDISID